jgi:transcriptional regulator with XRE-family HTH domain
MDTSTGPSIGQRIAHLRGHRTTQAGLAAAAGVSVDLIRKLEQGRRHTVGIGNLQRIARALDVDAGELLSKTQALPDPGEHSGAVAIRRALTRVDDLVGDQPDLEPLTLDEARRTVTLGWGYYWAGRYDQLGHLLPTAIGRSRATIREVPAGQRAEARDCTAQILQLSSCVLVHLGYGDVAHLALREALTLAADGSDPLLGSVLRGSLSWVLLTQGRYDEAHRLATASAANLAPSAESALPTWSIYGSLLLRRRHRGGSRR